MKKLLTEQEVIRLFKEGAKSISLGKGDIITPLAADRIKSLGISIVEKIEGEEIDSEEINPEKQKRTNKIVIASDHTGYKMKSLLINYLSGKKYEIIDAGTDSEESCDYPDIALTAAKMVALKNVDFGIVLDATGIPSAITANKIPGIRAATCYNEFSAKSAREHNNANVLVMGAKTLGEETIKSILDVWMETDFAGGRHQRRLDKIAAVEEMFLKS